MNAEERSVAPEMPAGSVVQGAAHPEATSKFDAQGLAAVAALLGGRDVLGRDPHTQFDAHELLESGLPTSALQHLVKELGVLREAAILPAALGMSVRTLQRHRDLLGRRLSQEQSSRTWKFAEILSHATAVFGTQDEAERWLERPAIGLDQRRPIDLLNTAAGVRIVETFLTRLEYGVYT